MTVLISAARAAFIDLGKLSGPLPNSSSPTSSSGRAMDGPSDFFSFVGSFLDWISSSISTTLVMSCVTNWIARRSSVRQLQNMKYESTPRK